MSDSTKIYCPHCGMQTAHYDLRGPLNDALLALARPLPDSTHNPSIDYAATFYRGVLGEAEDAGLIS